MESLPTDRILQFNPDTLSVVRALYNLDGPGRMDDAVDILEDWVKKQTHFKKKDFSRQYLEKTIIQCKGSVEKAKTKMDKYCSLRTVIPRFFNKYDVKQDFKDCPLLFDFIKLSFLPKMTPEFDRVLLASIHDVPKMTSELISQVYVFAFLVVEYIKLHDYFNRCILIIDYRDMNIKEVVSKLNLTDVTQWFTVFIEAYAMRIHSVHIISASKFIDLIINVLKKALPAKIGSRMRVHDRVDTLTEVVPKHILPKDYGGDEPPQNDIAKQWLDVVGSKEHVEFLKEMSGAVTDEHYRLTDKFRSEYMGMEGTFRTLSVD